MDHKFVWSSGFYFVSLFWTCSFVMLKLHEETCNAKAGNLMLNSDNPNFMPNYYYSQHSKHTARLA